jgi:hypothetical protein
LTDGIDDTALPENVPHSPKGEGKVRGPVNSSFIRQGSGIIDARARYRAAARRLRNTDLDPSAFVIKVNIKAIFKHPVELLWCF